MSELKAKTDPMKPTEAQVFVLTDSIPNAAENFFRKSKSLSEALSTCLFVIDTNALLLPYATGKNSLSQIKAIFEKLAKQKRLLIPGQVAREFIKHRQSKISEIANAIHQKISQISSPEINYPIFEGNEFYKSLAESLEKINEAKKKATTAQKNLMDLIRSWEWNDPVSEIYKSLFTAENVVEIKIDRPNLIAEMLQRYDLKIPPGYKDSAKDDLGVGDYLIWKTMLALGAQHKKDVVFISGDEKPDWQHQINGGAYLPRFELVDEFWRASDKSMFYIVSLSKFLELFEAKQDSIKEIKAEENRILESYASDAKCPECGSVSTFMISPEIGSTSHQQCKACGANLMIHRTRNEVVAHKFIKPAINPEDLLELIEEQVNCPKCETKCTVLLGSYQNATRWNVCSNCAAKFPVHRNRFGIAWVNRNYGKLGAEKDDESMPMA